LCLVSGVRADGIPKAEIKSFEIPFRLTVPKHVLVRAKINGKGPYNFILDTGAPALFVATKIAKKQGIEPDARGWGLVDRFEIEGGLVLDKVKGRIEDPFQLEGMNGLGLAGAELHGIIGYNILAKFRMEIDFTRDKMTWTRLDFNPSPPAGMGGKANATGGMEVVASIMKMLGAFVGAKANPETAPRGFLGFDLADGGDNPVVRNVLGKGPAAIGGVMVGDVLTHINGRGVVDRDDVIRLTKKLQAGATVKFTVTRDGQNKEIAVQAARGL
ncbi:MAG: PDZ domain-containing protein, partial [Candidatus Acidiferrum sp.]